MPHSNAAPRIVIPARFASHRLPGKPLVDLAGTPMVVRVYDCVAHAIPQADTVVAADDPRVIRVLEERGVPVVMTDPSWQSGTDRVADVARTLGWGEDDVVINVQGDEPLFPADLLVAFSKFCASREPLSMATVAVPIADTAELLNPNAVKVITRQDGSALTFSRAAVPFDRDRKTEEWELAQYRRHVGIYAYSNAVLQLLATTPPCSLEEVERLEQLRALWLGITIDVLDWPEAPPAGIDTEDDVERVVALLRVQEGQ